MMESGASSPRSSARSIIFSAVRVFTEPPTFTASNFTNTWASSGPLMRRSRTSGVDPTASRTLSQIIASPNF